MANDDFVRALHQSMRELGEQFGLKVPDFPVFDVQGVIKANPSFYRGEPDDYFAECYRIHAKGMGLDPNWLGESFDGPESGKPMRLVGMDPDGGAFCLRMVDEAGHVTHIRPDALKSSSR